jgi:hypothetical protein
MIVLLCILSLTVIVKSESLEFSSDFLQMHQSKLQHYQVHPRYALHEQQQRTPTALHAVRNLVHGYALVSLAYNYYHCSRQLSVNNNNGSYIPGYVGLKNLLLYTSFSIELLKKLLILGIANYITKWYEAVCNNE